MILDIGFLGRFRLLVEQRLTGGIRSNSKGLWINRAAVMSWVSKETQTPSMATQPTKHFQEALSLGFKKFSPG